MPPKNDKKSKGQNAKAQKTKTSGNKKKGPDFEPALLISSHYAGFKHAAKKLADLLAPLELSITQVGKAIAAYSEKKFNFDIRRDIVEAYSQYEVVRLNWEHFRDSFRASKDADTVPTGLAAGILAPQQANPAGSNPAGGVISASFTGSTGSAASTTPQESKATKPSAPNRPP
jgi:hypothetical protein